MRILYFCLWDFKYGDQDGVVKKILAQINVMKKSGLRVDYTYWDSTTRNVCINEDGELNILGKDWALKGLKACYLIADYVKARKYDGVFVRMPGRIDFAVLHVLRRLKERGSRILFEIPTFPYDQERTTFLGKAELMSDRIFRRGLKKYVDEIVTFSNEKRIFGISTLHVSNGVEYAKISPRTTFAGGDDIRLVAVANFADWHGYERIIHGIGEYYRAGGERGFCFYLVGSGRPEKEYLRLIEEYKLQDKVFLCGRMGGSRLDAVYEKCDIAVDALNRKEDISSIKSKEYTAKGLPVIYAYSTDARIEENREYFLEVPSEENAVDMKLVERFYDRIYPQGEESRKQVSEKIRRVAEKNFDISITFRPVVDYFLSAH